MIDMRNATGPWWRDPGLGARRRLPFAFGLLTERPVARDASDSYVLPACASRAIRADLRRLFAAVHPRYTLAAARRFKDFDRPVLIAWSQRDRFFPAAHAERLASDFPDARLVWIPGARSLSPEDRPDRLAAAIAEFAEFAGAPAGPEAGTR